GPHRPLATLFGLVDVVARSRRGGFQIRARAERPAFAPEHRDPRLLVAIKGAEGLGERLRGRAIDRIAHLRPAENDGGDGPLFLDADGAHARLLTSDVRRAQ